jgi:rubredoxin|tara:strand:+ start:225 stop:494 length:270 start_codon:yes stop_codon:yes gene_type:complete
VKIAYPGPALTGRRSQSIEYWLINTHGRKLTKELVMRKWQCLVCSFVYEEALGLPDDGIAPGTSWDDIPDDWMCPECGVGKEDFDMVEL